MILTLKSNVTPDIVDDTTATSSVSWLLNIIRPSIDIADIPVIGTYHLAPYGEPIPGLGLFIIIACLALLVFGLVKAFK